MSSFKKIEYFKYDVSSKILINQNNNRQEKKTEEERGGERAVEIEGSFFNEEEC